MKQNIDETAEIGNQILTVMPNKLESNKVYLTNDKDFVKKHIDEIWNMLEKGYADKGGLIVKSKEKLIDSIDLIKLVFAENGAIDALMTYKFFAGGKKMFLGAAKKSNAGKNAIQEIIKSDIEPYDNWFWGEVSGPIEHYFKKHNGRPIPKELVHKFVGSKRAITPSPDPNDPIHYSRQIADLSGSIEKAMYGFKDEAMAREVMESIDNYEGFRLSANMLSDKMFESENLDHIEDALNIIIEIVEFHEELNINELLPSWNEQLNLAMQYLESHIDDIEDSNKILQVKSAIKQGHYLKKEMQPLVLHQFHV